MICADLLLVSWNLAGLSEDDFSRLLSDIGRDFLSAPSVLCLQEVVSPKKLSATHATIYTADDYKVYAACTNALLPGRCVPAVLIHKRLHGAVILHEVCNWCSAAAVWLRDSKDVYVFASIHLPASNVTLPVYTAAVVRTVALLLRLRAQSKKYVHRRCNRTPKVHFVLGMDANSTPSSHSTLCGGHLLRGPYSHRTGVPVEAFEQFLLLDVHLVNTFDPPPVQDVRLNHNVGPSMFDTDCLRPHHAHRSWSASTLQCIDFVASSLSTAPSSWGVPSLLAGWKSTDHLPLAYVVRLQVVLQPNCNAHALAERRRWIRSHPQLSTLLPVSAHWTVTNKVRWQVGQCAPITAEDIDDFNFKLRTLARESGGPRHRATCELHILTVANIVQQPRVLECDRRRISQLACVGLADVSSGMLLAAKRYYTKAI